MTYGSADLSSTVKLRKRSDLYPNQMRTIIRKNAEGKSKNKNKESEPKVMNSF